MAVLERELGQDINLADYLGIGDPEGESTGSKQQTARAGQM
jgi:hypothetical protein